MPHTDTITLVLKSRCTKNPSLTLTDAAWEIILKGTPNVGCISANCKHPPKLRQSVGMKDTRRGRVRRVLAVFLPPPPLDPQKMAKSLFHFAFSSWLKMTVIYLPVLYLYPGDRAFCCSLLFSFSCVSFFFLGRSCYCIRGSFERRNSGNICSCCC